MANTLTNLAADIYKSADIVGRELVGAIPSVTINAGVERVAFNDPIRSHFTRKPQLNTSYTPSMTLPEGDDQTVDSKTMTINKVANVKIPWTGEEIKHVANGSGFETIFGDQIAQAMRAITNQIEVDLCLDIKNNASRAWGVQGTTPFGSNFNEMANLRKILVDNGTPFNGENITVMDSAAGTNLRNLSNLQKVNESGNEQLLRQGELLNLQGLRLKESAGIAYHTKGTGASYVTNGTALPIGTTAIPLITGTGTVLAGDVVTFAGDTNKYVVASGISAPGTITLAAPGLQRAIPASATAMTIGASYTGNLAFNRAAVELGVRPPAQPAGGDTATDRMTVQDPFSGLVYEIAAYKGYGKAMFDITTFYGVKTWKPEFVALLLG